MPQELCQPHEVVAVVLQKLVRHRVPEQMRVQVDADQGRILLAQRPDASFAQWPTLPDEDPAGLHRWSGIEVSQQCTSSRERQRHGALLVALAVLEDDPSASFRSDLAAIDRADRLTLLSP